ncbi:MAG: alpha/beta fold hydrolase [Isosphaeraceae bacterium]
MPYLTYQPTGLTGPNRPRPALIFLHGAAEVGTDVERVRRVGPPAQVEGGRRLPFVVIAPQSAATRWDLRALDLLLDHVLADGRVDPARVALTGFSMGGAATWAWAAERPDRFAAIAPMCGVGDPSRADRLRDVQVWAFHGELDRVVPPSRTHAMVDHLRSKGANARLTIYPDLGHDCWTRAYAEASLYEWLLRQRKGSAAASE